MSGFIDDTSNIDAAEIAAEYRTPDQGVSAKSNSNVAWNDYRKMTPRANQSGNIITTAGSQTLQAQDFGGTAGFTSATSSFTTGSAKGASTQTVSGVFTANAYAQVNTGSGASAAQGTFGLGAQGGTSGISLANVASFPSGCTLTGYGTKTSGGFGGTFYIITDGSTGATNWTTLYHRALYPGGQLGIGNQTFYNLTSTFNRSDMTYITSGVFAGQEVWQMAIGGFSGTTGPTMTYPFTVEFA